MAIIPTVADPHEGFQPVMDSIAREFPGQYTWHIHPTYQFGKGYLVRATCSKSLYHDNFERLLKRSGLVQEPLYLQARPIPFLRKEHVQTSFWYAPPVPLAKVIADCQLLYKLHLRNGTSSALKKGAEQFVLEWDTRLNRFYALVCDHSEDQTWRTLFIQDECGTPDEGVSSMTESALGRYHPHIVKKIIQAANRA